MSLHFKLTAFLDRRDFLARSCSLLAAMNLIQPVFATENDVVSILSTDYSLDLDVDDWFDVIVFATFPKLNPYGIVLDFHPDFPNRRRPKPEPPAPDIFSWDAIEGSIGKLLASVGRDDIPLARGIRGKLKRENGEITAPPCHDGARFILDTMRRMPGKVRLFAVGSLRNEALAWSLNPGLFARKIDRLYWIGGSTVNLNEHNLNLDRLAVEIDFNAPIPKVWAPAWYSRTERSAQKFDAAHEKKMRAIDHPAIRLLDEGLDIWRATHPAVMRTKQDAAHGKNLWSNPLFLHAIGKPDLGMTWKSGRCHYDSERTTQFGERSDGADEALLALEPVVISDWLLDHLRNLPR